jgi:16S rRNA (uracil1498-N3)-methyltransferase
MARDEQDERAGSGADEGQPPGAGGPRFVLANDPAVAEPELVPEDVQHALRVLRLGPGATCVGLDGRGRAWPLVVRGVTRRGLTVEVLGDPATAPPPGAPGGGLAVEVALSLPRGSRAEDCVGRLTQLGAARITPLVAERTPPHGREAGEARRERLTRAAREAAKQCGRLWFPEVGAPAPLAAWLAGLDGTPVACLDPYAEASLAHWVAPRAAAAVALAIGPEGGFTTAEEALLTDLGAARLRLGGYVLRVETAAEAALAVVTTAALVP